MLRILLYQGIDDPGRLHQENFKYCCGNFCYSWWFFCPFPVHAGKRSGSKELY